MFTFTEYQPGMDMERILNEQLGRGESHLLKYK